MIGLVEFSWFYWGVIAIGSLGLVGLAALIESSKL